MLSAMDQQAIAAYLDRIGAVRPPVLDDTVLDDTVLDAAALAGLHRAHLLTVPFENLSIHLGEPISLAEDDLLTKIVTRRRGGFCYELNGTFALLLEALGARVGRVAARVYGADGLGPPLDHLALIVTLPDGSGPWLADVGFGSHSVFPLLLDERGDQDDPGGRFRLADAPRGDIDVTKDGQPQYRIERRERALDEFAPTCWWQQTWPESHFRASTICSRLTPDGRISISEDTLITTSGGSRVEEKLNDGELLAAYRDRFGVSLDRVPRRAG
jgi:N-hydroxyarylamine O-acetyltransferase